MTESMGTSRGATHQRDGEHIQSADGLRGLAALNVTFAHFVAAFVPPLLHPQFPTIFSANPEPGKLALLLQFPLISLFYNGHFAVVIFFVLSGYVLSLPYSRGDIQRLKERLWARYIRLNIPIFAISVLSYVCLERRWYFNIRAGEMSGSAWFSRYFSSPLSLFSALRKAAYESIVLGAPELLPPLWTINIEFVGSVIVLAFYISKPRGRVWVPVACVLGAMLLFKGQFLHYAAILLGSLIAFQRVPRLISTGMMILGIYLGGFQYASYWYDFLPEIPEVDRKGIYNLIGAWCVVSAVVNGVGAKVLSSKPFQYLGKLSYSLYLVHFVILSSVAAGIFVSVPRGKGFLAGVFCVYLLGAIGCAHVFSKWVDEPAIRISRRFVRWLKV